MNKQSSKRDTSTKLILDGKYLEGLLGAALRDGYLEVNTDSGEFADYPISLTDKIKGGMSRSHFKKRSLTLALFAEELLFHAPPYLADLSNLSENGLCHGTLEALDTDNLEEPYFAFGDAGELQYTGDFEIHSFQIARQIKPFTLAHIRTKLKEFLAWKEADFIYDLMRRHVGDLFEFVIAWKMGFPEAVFHNTSSGFHELLHEMTGKSTQSLALREVLRILDEEETHWFHAVVGLTGILIKQLVSAVHWSEREGAILATDRVIGSKSEKTPTGIGSGLFALYVES